MGGSRDRVSCGKNCHYCPDILSTIDDCCKDGFDFICLPIVNPRYKREFIEGPALKRDGAFTRSDMLLTSGDWGSLVVAKVSPWIDVDSANPALRKNSEMAFDQELTYANHLGVPAVMLSIQSAECCNLARIINTHIFAGHNYQYWLQIPLIAAEDCLDDVIENIPAENDPTNADRKEIDTWGWWNRVRTLCDSSKKLSIVLEVSADLPSKAVMDRWLGEPVKAAVLPTDIFITNRKGFPVLSKAHQALVHSLLKLDVQIIVSGPNNHPERSFRIYQQYLEHLWQTQEPVDNVTQFAKGYEDYLQCPLQPLMDNLQSPTYEVFEKDPVKYSQYQLAVYKALLDRVSDEDKNTKVITLMVLGAGRGPLVTASINAANKAERKIHVYAVEKNPNAVVTLENLRTEQWGNQVTVVMGDMRHWEAPTKADIIVSELLGSFGDNELSPECLDGAQKFLKDDGISIPYKYTSYLAPLMSSKLWNETKLSRDVNKSPESPFETPYVVRLHNVHLLSKAQPLFTFVHPNRGVIDNNRHESLTFPIEQDAVLHGFGGYFDCLLYKDISLSIVPQTHSPGMFSWFPIYFPIKNPQELFQGDDLCVQFWRLCTHKDVWYEWTISDPVNIPLHNPKGRSYTIGL
ncbi:hypothetical protein CAPTEDRAFT_161444 [Capitella teleta]|uniref:Protein arginine N-methyltransferase n=1 Tax=Capitella teleta TaxID=283909 RepID=R7V8B5_CAPTE|nr:hypothetical protein CAPTEDRAFT_161444 [Capitella teleta]|eukprot:ELU14784.1 hypothetical protein CAPTEDRAFT_161444 [Capitella teleta]